MGAAARETHHRAMILKTPRLVLREFTADDFEAVHAYGSDPEVVEFLPWGPNSEQDTIDFLERNVKNAAVDPREDFVLGVVRRCDDRLLGGVGLHLPDAESHLGMLGYVYHRDAWGQGYATEAARAIVSFGFDVLGLRRIWAGCDPENRASARVLEKIGMSLEGHLREDQRVRGRLRDSLMFGILATEYYGSETDPGSEDASSGVIA